MNIKFSKISNYTKILSLVLFLGIFSFSVKADDLMSFDCYPEYFECPVSLDKTRMICNQDGDTEEEMCACGTSTVCEVEQQ
jgi:hypothetical protein